MLSQKLVLSAAGAAADRIYVDDVFSTFLYDGTSSAQTITNGIDLSGEGGMVWIKGRSHSVESMIWDTERGARKYLITNNTSAEATSGSTAGLTQFNSDGFGLGSNWNTENFSSYTYCSWSFRKCPGFFDVVSYTGNGTAGRTIAHSLGSTPGMVVVKNSSTATTKWAVWHTSYGDNNRLYFNENTAGAANQTNHVRTASSTTFTVGSDYDVNHSGESYVAYIFANNDQSFGENGDEAIIKCGSYTGNGGTQSINVGFEPQFLITKKSDGSGNWFIHDIMRKFSATGTNEAATLRVNSNVAEAANTARIHVNPTGFDFDNEGSDDVNSSNSNYVYVAIRRSHKPPSAGTDVLGINDLSTPQNVWTPGFAADALFVRRYGSTDDTRVATRLIGNKKFLATNSTGSESSDGTSYYHFDDPTGTIHQSYIQGGSNTINYAFKRAPGFFDVVTYTGTGSARTVNHNLGVAPELMIVKDRDSGSYWAVYSSALGATKYLSLASTNAANTSAMVWNDTEPTSSVFTVNQAGAVNTSGNQYIAYLFASLNGISKIGTYTGTGSDLNIDCGFTNGARFVLIKRTSGTTDWWLLDTARGINSGNDPALKLNESSAETSSYDLVDPYSAGFTAVADTAAINSSGQTYIFLAIA